MSMLLESVSSALAPATTQAVEAKVVVIIPVIYGILQIAKKSPWLQPYLTGIWAVAVNVGLATGGYLIGLPANQWFTVPTGMAILTIIAGAAGVHGTVRSFSVPTVAAVTPPSLEVKEVPAHLEPDNPAAVPVPPVANLEPKA